MEDEQIKMATTERQGRENENLSLARTPAKTLVGIVSESAFPFLLCLGSLKFSKFGRF